MAKYFYEVRLSIIPRDEIVPEIVDAYVETFEEVEYLMNSGFDWYTFEGYDDLKRVKKLLIKLLKKKKEKCNE